MTITIVTFLVVALLLIFSGFISMLGRWVRYIYFVLGSCTASISLDNYEPLWLVILCLILTHALAFNFFIIAEKNKAGSFVIPDRVSTNMSAYFTGTIGGVIWVLIT
jgi:hypothetical protein